MAGYLLRYIFAGIGAGAIGVLAARLIAHWIDQDAWLVRGVSYFLILSGIVGIAALLGVVVALKILGVAIVVCPVMAWLDVTCDRKEAEMGAERMEKFLKKK